ncbi:MAG: SDR family oxidoreductase [Acidobacteriia bacterium]|nr:SDR family oxidoreductase [Terriglobia bacterium]
MKLAGKVVVVTGGGNGIGRALCRRFSADGLEGLVVADIDAAGAEDVARETGGIALQADVSRESDIRRMAQTAMEKFGRIDLFCSNAGIMVRGGEEVSDAEWDRIWSINVKAHIYAARAVLPDMLRRGDGYFLQTVSAAGLLNQIGSAPYGVTKHAALGFAEWLAITYGDRGIKVSCLCPQGVRTAMLASGRQEGRPHFLEAGALEPEQVAHAVVEGIGTEQFLILPHPEVLEYFQRKASSYDRWLRGMCRLQSRI